MRKAQVQMAETIGILFIFIVLVALGVSFWFKIQSSSISQKTVELQELQAVEVVQIVSNLPEIQCSRLNEVEDNCFDERKMIAFSKYLQGHTSDYSIPGTLEDQYDRLMEYYPLLRLSKIEVEIIYPFFWDDADHDGLPTKFENVNGQKLEAISVSSKDFHPSCQGGSIPERVFNSTNPSELDLAYFNDDGELCPQSNLMGETVGLEDKYSDNNSNGVPGDCEIALPLNNSKWLCNPDFIRPEWPDQDDDGMLDEWECVGNKCYEQIYGYDDPDGDGLTYWDLYVNGRHSDDSRYDLVDPITDDDLVTFDKPTKIVLYNLTGLNETSSAAYSASSTTVPVSIKDPVTDTYKFAKLHITTYRQSV
ncbi:hypothetical protein HN419_01950 [Candidatus Woesearchaeota archaeon]|jgi:hypothetical protein|nr:hypothetical protein [Candidatus Woesearchaeota archaeon]MBT3537240.1 hypothetical protein [Candidatus Woesearchaeota archaeon]MBT4696785.1 hypothetical protein [Candidatus Woesearchaeota archaeon]MBT7106450.1 hypothetical protein [Candidatus Woesearchaeota archaeon]MBT7931175.1 hypothetical protein [Candidatus Woesearchaeota archaeon]